jgi:outer membrane protein assembly factor BamB
MEPLWSRRPWLSVSVILACNHLIAADTRAADQPQWGERYTRNMVSTETGLPDSFDLATGQGVKQVITLGSQTWGTPVVAGGRILIGTDNDPPRDPRHSGDRAILLCLDEKDGSLKWQLVVPKMGSADPYLDWPNDGLVSPATVDGNRVYVMSNRYEIMCLDLDGQANGNDGPYMDEGRHMAPQGAAPMDVTAQDADILWLFDMPSQAGTYPHDSAHGSPLIDGDFLYVNSSNGVDNTHRRIRAPGGPSLIVLDKKTGRLLARDDEHIGPRIFHSTWSSPAMGVVAGRRLALFAGGDGILYAFEALQSAPPADSIAKLKRVWRFDGDPTAPKEDVHQYIGNRTEGPSNVKSMPVFHDGRVYLTLGGDIWWGKKKAWLKCIDASQTGDITATGLVWSYELSLHCCCTPSVWEGMVFVADCGGQIHCLDARTGKACWTHDAEAEIWASTLVADGKVYAATRRGVLWILAASREKKVISKTQFDGPIAGTPVAANGVLYITTDNKLYALKR